MNREITDVLNPTITNYTIKVLLVDDQLIVGETVRRMLTDDNDIEFIFCQKPLEALQIAREIKPTLILQDLVMPDIEGLTLVKFYRATEELKDVPIIVLSSKEEATTKAQSFAVGANDYLVKLPDKIELVARIRHHSKGYINLLERNEAYKSLKKSQEALASELAKAGDYVVSLLPKEMKSDDVETYWRFIPSAQLGGDAFGYHWIDDENFAIYLLDVCGHGVGSALLSVSALNVLRGQSLAGADYLDPANLLASLNKAFQMTHHNGLYFTIWYGVFNKNTNILKFAAGGHPPAFAVNNDGTFFKLNNENFIIGGIPTYPFESNEVKLTLPCNIYMYSDGVYEIEKSDGTFWELNEMIELIAENPGEEHSDIDTLHKYILELGQNKILDDDFSMVKIVLK